MIRFTRIASTRVSVAISAKMVIKKKKRVVTVTRPINKLVLLLAVDTYSLLRCCFIISLILFTISREVVTGHALPRFSYTSVSRPPREPSCRRYRTGLVAILVIRSRLIKTLHNKIQSLSKVHDVKIINVLNLTENKTAAAVCLEVRLEVVVRTDEEDVHRFYRKNNLTIALHDGYSRQVSIAFFSHEHYNSFQYLFVYENVVPVFDQISIDGRWF